MSEKLSVEAQMREDFGKNVARRLRRDGRIPAVVYGGKEPSLPVAVDPKSILAILHSGAGHNAIFELTVQGKPAERVMLRDWQLEPVYGALLHVDMVRVAMDARLKVKIPIHVSGEPEGVKLQGGIFEFVLREVEVECLADAIPDFVTIDVSTLTIGKNIRVSDLPVAAQVKVLTDPGRVVAHVVAPKAEEEAPAAEAAAEAAPAEPEVIRKGKAEAEEGEEAEAAPPEEKKEKKEKKEKESK
jgi:large subunit ribosomal protein L25